MTVSNIVFFILQRFSLFCKGSVSNVAVHLKMYGLHYRWNVIVHLILFIFFFFCFLSKQYLLFMKHFRLKYFAKLESIRGSGILEQYI